MTAEVEPACTTVSLADAVAVGVGVGVGVGVDIAGSGLVVVPGPGDHGALGLVLPHHQPLAFSCQTSPLTYASSVTLLVVVSAVPLTATLPPDVIVQALPLASMTAEAEPACTTVSLTDGVAVGVGVDAAGSGLVVVPGPGDHGALGLVLPHHQPLAFSCQTSPLTYASSVTLLVVVSAVPLTAT